jgi:deoxyadenosine/deoxycytidine kinase
MSSTQPTLLVTPESYQLAGVEEVPPSSIEGGGLNWQPGGKPLVIVVDGIIGAGKSTLIAKCLLPELEAKGLRCTLVTEPVEKWKSSGALEQFYKDPARRAYQFQTRVFHDRIKEVQLQWKAHKNVTDIFILERSIFTDRIFMDMLYEAGELDESEKRDYEDLWTMWSKLMPCKPDLFLYLRPKLDEVMSRLRKRGRAGEGGISREYQAALLAKHDQFLLASKDRKVTICQSEALVLPLETDENFEDLEEVKRKIGDLLYQFIHPNSPASPTKEKMSLSSTSVFEEIRSTSL